MFWSTLWILLHSWVFLFSREEKKKIPFFRGPSEDLYVIDWLRKADHVARSNNWDDAQKLKFYSARLKGDALDWHLEYSNSRVALNFTDWRTTLLARFCDTAEIERLRNKLSNLRQQPDQSVLNYGIEWESLTYC